MFMREGITMATTLDPNAQARVLFDKLSARQARARGRLVLRHAVRQRGVGSAQTSRSPRPYPGKIVPLNLADWGGTVMAQKDSFLCAARGTDISVAFTRKFGAGFFGGEGFILQKLQGDGLAFPARVRARCTPSTSRPGELLRVDTGLPVAFQPTVEYDISACPGSRPRCSAGGASSS
jgi:uncharacterized protein (AIM24 family)